MEVKLFEIRDKGTFIPAMAIKPKSRTDSERFLMARAGFGTYREDHDAYVFLFRLSGGEWQHDVYEWGGARTMPNAHNYIIENWDQLESGQVICVEHILGERPEPKTSESLGE